MVSKVILGLGSNIEDRVHYLKRGIELIGLTAGKVKACSSMWETEPWGFTADTPFLNMVIIVETDLLPGEMLEKIHSVEKTLGRRREGTGYQSRTMDIDILFWNDEIIKTNDLSVPHPAVADRLFVLFPLNEVAPELIHPEKNISVARMLEQCTDKSGIRLFGSFKPE